MFDTINAHKLADTVTFDLYLPNEILATVPAPGVDADGNDNRQQMTMTVRRMSSAAMQRYLNEGKNVTISGLKKQSKGKREMSVTAESIEEKAVNLLIFAVVDWEGFTNDGERVPCTEENVRKLIADETYIWIRNQVDVAVGDDTLYDLGNS